MTKETRTGAGGRRFPLVLAIAGLGLLAACGGGDRLAREEFSDRLESIGHREGERWGRLADQVSGLNPNQVLPDEVRTGMRKLAAGNRRAADELDGLNPPADAEDEIHALVKALRARADTIERAAREERTTLRELDQGGTITSLGHEIDRAFEGLREEGFLPEDPTHGAEAASEHPNAGSSQPCGGSNERTTTELAQAIGEPGERVSRNELVLRRDGSKAEPFVADLDPDVPAGGGGVRLGDAAIGAGVGGAASLLLVVLSTSPARGRFSARRRSRSASRPIG